MFKRLLQNRSKLWWTYLLFKNFLDICFLYFLRSNKNKYCYNCIFLVKQADYDINTALMYTKLVYTCTFFRNVINFYFNIEDISSEFVNSRICSLFLVYAIF